MSGNESFIEAVVTFADEGWLYYTSLCLLYLL